MNSSVFEEMAADSPIVYVSWLGIALMISCG